MYRRSDALYIRDIKEAIEAIFAYTRDITFDDFRIDRMRYSAVIREFELIGEAVGNLARERGLSPYSPINPTNPTNLFSPLHSPFTVRSKSWNMSRGQKKPVFPPMICYHA